MASQWLTWTAELLPGAVLRVTFTGQGGVGSGGNRDGERMQEAIRAAVAEHRPKAVVIDLCHFEYRYGDWIGALPLPTFRALGRDSVCVVTTGKTAAALRSLWEFGKLGQPIPLVGDLDEALRYVARSGEPGGAEPTSDPPG